MATKPKIPVKPLKKPAPDPETCEHCKHFDNSANTDSMGWCNRYPPVPVFNELAEGNISQERPAVEDCDTCGEFKRRLNS